MRKKPRRTATVKVPQVAAKPQTSLLRAANWLMSSDLRFAIAFAVVFTVTMSLRVFGVSHFGFDLKTIQVVVTFVLFGIFLGVILVTDSAKSYRQSGYRIRVFCGAIAGAGIALVFTAPFEAVTLGAVVGGVLGHFGKRWAQHI